MAEIPIKSSAVSLVIIRKAEERCEVLLLKRTKTLAGQWCQIAGGLEEGETAWQAAMREAHEETGLVPNTLFSADICEQFYEADKERISMLPVFVGFVDDSQQVTLNDEHSDYCWVSFRAALELVTFPGQRTVLRHVEMEFVERAPSDFLKIAL